jgi:hypothetical protein
MAVCLVGIGVQIGRGDKGESNGDIDNRVCVPDGDRNRGSVDGYSPQEMIFVLDNVKRLTHGEERAIMDAIIDLVEGSKNNEVD